MYSSSRSPDQTSVQQVAVKALQSKNVSTSKIDGGIFRTFRLQPAADYFYVLRCKPSSQIRLLRTEEERLPGEAAILQMLRGRSDILAPRLIEYHATTVPFGCFYLISGPFRGSILSDIEPSLTTQHLAYIDRGLGQHARRLAQVTGSKFGDVRQEGTYAGSSSWARCFASLLEGVLLDAEDALVSLPYDFIRDIVQCHRATLDQITTPRLTLVEIKADKNIVVDPSNWSVSGILDFSTLIWGDPYLSDCFYLTSVHFADGFGNLPNRTADERVRQYLYTLYHSLLAVVRHCYRPNDDGDEMEARKNLTSALEQLGKIADG